MPLTVRLHYHADNAGAASSRIVWFWLPGLKVIGALLQSEVCATEIVEKKDTGEHHAPPVAAATSHD
ncbi:MAG TPA: hypothetical protein VGK24_21675 [Candidatus Angelobacter sp.]|jgi:hypothetical protein